MFRKACGLSYPKPPFDGVLELSGFLTNLTDAAAQRTLRWLDDPVMATCRSACCRFRIWAKFMVVQLNQTSYLAFPVPLSAYSPVEVGGSGRGTGIPAVSIGTIFKTGTNSCLLYRRYSLPRLSSLGLSSLAFGRWPPFPASRSCRGRASWTVRVRVGW